MAISNVSEMRHLAGHAGNQGKTFAVTREVFEHFASKLKVKRIGKVEQRAVENLLGVAPGSARTGLTRNCTCKHCGHTFSFVDHIASALLLGVHSVAELQRFVGRSRDYWLTVDTDLPRVVRCPRCYLDFVAPHCCYVSGGYAYT